MTNKIYHLMRRSTPNAKADEAYGFVVVAQSPVKARQIVAEAPKGDGPGDEGPDVWRDAAQSFCVCVGQAGRGQSPRILLRDYNGC